MNREILFRGKCIYNGEWVYGDLIHTLGGHPLICTKHVFGAPAEVVEVDYATVGQYTGLTDKNDNKIFKGDVVKCNNKVEEYIGIVDWDMCNPSMCIRYKTKRGFDDVEYDFIICGNMTIEVLGNIHDNPSLLKGGKNG